MSTFLSIIGCAGSVLVIVLTVLGLIFICIEAGKDAVRRDRQSDSRTAEQIIADIGRRTQEEILGQALQQARRPHGQPPSDARRPAPRPPVP